MTATKTVNNHNETLRTKKQLDVLLDTQFVGSSIVYLDSVNSTNTFAKNLPGKLLRDGMVIITEKQLAGRGTRRRKWISTDQDLTFTLILKERERRPLGSYEEPPIDKCLFTITSVAIAEAIYELTKLVPGIAKNDIGIDDLKLGGILVEPFFKSGQQWHAVGVGINVNSRLRDFPAYLQGISTTISESLGRPVNKSRLMNIILARLEEIYLEYLVEGFESMVGRGIPWVSSPFRRPQLA